MLTHDVPQLGSSDVEGVQTEKKSPMRDELIEILRCPIDGTPLVLADETLLNRVNDAIRDRRALDRAEQTVELAIDGGLLTEDGGWVYPVRGGIPVLIANDAIRVPQP